MQIKPLYKNTDYVTISDYLAKCGVVNTQKWLSHKALEKSSDYDNIDEWCEKLNYAINEKEKFYLLVDSDLDGYFSSSMFYIYCKHINPNVNIIPIFHTEKQHGIDKDNLKYLKSQEPSILVVLDAGTNDIKQDKKLTELGWQILCADHHKQEKKINSYCLLVNNQVSNKVVNKGLSGTGVAWKTCKRYDELYGYNFSKKLISYVAIANIGDSMSFTFTENETFRHWGMLSIYKVLKPFVANLNRNDETDNKAFSFGLITNINSLIRLGTQEDKVELFKALCGEIDSAETIEKCKKLHNKQSSETKRLLEHSVEIVDNDKFVIARILEKTTLTGLVANKMMSIYEKPIFLTHSRDNGELAGSVRSPFEIKDLLPQELFNYNQGHNCAFGTSYQKENEQALIKALNSLDIPSEPLQTVFISTTTKDIPNYLYDFIDDYRAYFGMDIPIPRIHIKPFSLYNDEIQVLGAKQRTIKFRRNGIDFILFNCSNKLKEQLKLNSQQKQMVALEFIGEPCYNEFRGQRNKQFIIDSNNIEISYNKKSFEDFM